MPEIRQTELTGLSGQIQTGQTPAPQTQQIQPPQEPPQVQQYAGSSRLEPVPVGPQPGQEQTRVLPQDQEAPKPPEGMRYIGFCQDCHDFVELTGDFDCGNGHKRDRVRVALLIEEDAPRPHMPRLNLGALVMPALWGPFHGQWYMILFYPLWLLLDNLLYSTVHGNGNIVLAVIALLLTAAFTIFYALNANSWGYPRAAASKTPEEYLARERLYALVFGLVAVLFLVFATWYNLMVRPGL